MLPDTDDISVLIQFLAWTLLYMTNRALKNTPLDAVFPTEHAMQAIWSRSHLTFATGLQRVVRSSTAPTIAYFKTLPLQLERVWAVYIIVLEKEGCLPMIYIGSGTSFQAGVKSRMQIYDTRVRTGKFMKEIPFYVDKALRDGYVITKKGFLVWSPIPPPSQRLQLRCLFLVLEAVFTMVFWAMNSRDKDYEMPALCPWPRKDFPYDGCCTHFSLNEGISNELDDVQGIDPAEFDRLEAERKKLKNRQYIANKGEGVHAANTKKYGEQALEEQRYKCTVCDLTFRSNAKLVEHQGLPIHINKAAGQGRSTKGRGGSQLAVKNKKFWCETCKHAASTEKRLAVHLKGPGHAKKLRTLASSSKLD